MTQFARLFRLSLQKIKINTLTVERKHERLTESLTESKSNSQTKLVIYRFVK